MSVTEAQDRLMAYIGRGRGAEAVIARPLYDGRGTYVVGVYVDGELSGDLLYVPPTGVGARIATVREVLRARMPSTLEEATVGSEHEGRWLPKP